MKMRNNCQSCGRPFFSPVIVVYVFKRHLCPEHKGEVLNFDGKIFSCPKCKREFNKNNIMEYGQMGTSLMGTTRKWSEVKERMSDGKTDYDKVPVPEKQLCQKCLNFERIKKQREEQDRGESKIRKIPSQIKDADIYRYEVMKKVNEEYIRKQRSENQIEMEKKREAEIKAKLVKKMTDELTKKEEKK